MTAGEHRYWLGLGANLGDAPTTLRAFVGALRRHGVATEAASSLYETEPQGLRDQPAFVNAAICVRAALAPPDLLRLVKRLERQLGRIPGARFGPRAVDCDILLWSGGAFSSADLEVPHPRLGERRFALMPLADIAADLVISGDRRVCEALAELDPAGQRVIDLGTGLDS